MSGGTLSRLRTTIYRLRGLVLSLVAVTYFLVLPSVTSPAQGPKEEYKRIQNELSKHQKKLESVKKVETSVIEELRKTTAELNEIERQLAAQRKRIKGSQMTITALHSQIKTQEENLQAQRNHLKKRLRVIQRMSKEKDALLVLIAGEDTSQAMKTMRYMSDVSAYDFALINRYKEALKSLNLKQEELKKMLAELRHEEGNLAKLEDSLEEKKKEREALLAGVRKEKGSHEKMIAELKETANRLSKIMRDLEKRERELRKKKGSRTAPPTEEPVEDSGFARLKGALPWPATGSVAIQYGTQVDPVFNLPVFRSGVHIKSPLNSPVRAVHEGRIVFADHFKGYGQLVILTHGGGYHTLYGNLAKIFLRNGAIIKGNQTLGEVGESSALGTSGLYFEIRYKGKPLDPHQWLRK